MERGIDRAHGSMSAGLDGAATKDLDYVLPVDGIVDLDIETFAGDVVVRGGRDTGNEIRILVTEVARHGSDRKEEAAASLAQVEVKAEIQRGGDVPVMVLRGTTAHDEHWLHRTNIDIELPELRRVRVKTRGGKVHVYENRGACSVETTDGEIRMFTPWAITEDVTLVGRGADIIMRSFLGTCGRFDIDCVNGHVATRIESGEWKVLDRRNDQDTLHATLGACENRVLIRNVDAAVRVSVVKDPMEYGSLFASP